MAIVTKSGKGARLTSNEVDNNFLELSGSISDVIVGDLNVASASYALTASYAMNGGGGGASDSFTMTTVGTLGTGTLKITWSSIIFASTAEGTQTLTPVSYPTININGGMGFSGTLSSITIADLTFVDLSLGSISSLTTVNLPALTTIVTGQMFPSVNISSCSSLTTLTIPSLTTVADSINISWTGNAFSETTVNNILVKFAGTTASNGSLNLSGGTSAAPSGAGLTAKSTLEGRGWTITTN